jgi:hypothetical protein
LQGKTESEGGRDGPWPVQLPGEEKDILSDQIGRYVNNEFFYYYQFYTNCKHSGHPLSGGWTEWPPWICQLIRHFDSTIEMVRNYNEAQAYQQAGRVS